jgi:hypothetical protein
MIPLFHFQEVCSMGRMQDSGTRRQPGVGPNQMPRPDEPQGLVAFALPR